MVMAVQSSRGKRRPGFRYIKLARARVLIPGRRLGYTKRGRGFRLVQGVYGASEIGGRPDRGERTLIMDDLASVRYIYIHGRWCMYSFVARKLWKTSGPLVVVQSIQSYACSEIFHENRRKVETGPGTRVAYGVAVRSGEARGVRVRRFSDYGRSRNYPNIIYETRIPSRTAKSDRTIVSYLFV